MKRYRLSRPAERDLDDIRHYLGERVGVRIARRVMSEIRSGISLLSAEPGIGHVREDLTGRSSFGGSIPMTPAPSPLRLFALFTEHRIWKSCWVVEKDLANDGRVPKRFIGENASIAEVSDFFRTGRQRVGLAVRRSI